MAAALPALPRVLFVLDGTGTAGVENRISALRAVSRPLAPFLRDGPVLARTPAHLHHHGPAASVWHPSRTSTSISPGPCQGIASAFRGSAEGLLSSAAW